MDGDTGAYDRHTCVNIVIYLYFLLEVSIWGPVARQNLSFGPLHDEVLDRCSSDIQEVRREPPSGPPLGGRHE